MAQMLSDCMGRGLEGWGGGGDVMDWVGWGGEGEGGEDWTG